MLRKMTSVLSAVAFMAAGGAVLAEPVPCPQGQPKSRVIGGKDADRGEYPFQAFVLANGGMCGGTLVSPTTVLTAAHCVTASKTKRKLHGSAFRVRLGSIDAYSGGEYYKSVKRVVVHENYNPDTLENDIAILELSKPSRIAPVQLEGFSAPGIDDARLRAIQGTVLGWGRIDPKDEWQTSSVLKFASVPMVPGPQCQGKLPRGFERFGAIDARRLCAGGEGGVDTCNGDSGGPLVVRQPNGNFVQLGLTSLGARVCGQKGVYGVYTRIGAFTAFLKDNVRLAPAGTPAIAMSWARERPRAAPMAAMMAAAQMERLQMEYMQGQRMQALLMSPAASAPGGTPVPLSVWVNGDADVPVSLIPGATAAPSADSAEYVWNVDEAKVIRRGTLVAEGITDISRLSGVLGKWRALPLIAQLAAGKPQVALSLGAEPAGGAFADGAVIEPTVRRPADPSLRYLTLFDLTSDGSVDYLFPEAGDGELTGDLKLGKFRAQCPFGSDHLVAIVTSQPPSMLRRQLQDAARTNAPSAYTAVSSLRGTLSGTYAIGVTQLLTAPKP